MRAAEVREEGVGGEGEVSVEPKMMKTWMQQIRNLGPCLLRALVRGLTLNENLQPSFLSRCKKYQHHNDGNKSNDNENDFSAVNRMGKLVRQA